MLGFSQWYRMIFLGLNNVSGLRYKLGLTVVALFLSLIGVQAQIYVAPNGTGDGRSWAQASNLVDAVDNASAGDELRLRHGNYGVSTTITFNKRLEILGGFSGTEDERDPSLYPSVIDGQGSVNMIQTGNGSGNTLFDGISFINGYADVGVYDEVKGGALYISGNGTRISNCVFRNNTSENRIGSGAIYLWSADDVVIDGCVFENNRVEDNVNGSLGGGAIHVRFGYNTRILNTTFRRNYSFYIGGAVDDWGDNTLFENCVFEGNESEGNGGAVYVRGYYTNFTNCVFEDNKSEGNGGGVYVNNDYTHITDCNFIDNQGTDGGGVASSGGVEISTSYFEGNQAHERGGAIYNYRFAEPSIIEQTRFLANTADLGGAIYNFSEVGLRIVSSLFEANQAMDEGGAVFNNRFIEIVNTTFVANTNTAIVHNRFQTIEYNRYPTTVYNSIFYLNTAKNSGYLVDIAPSEGGADASDKDVRNNIVQEFSEGTNNQVTDPLFINNASDFRLQSNSPAVNAGDQHLYNEVSDVDAVSSTDLDGNPRVFGTQIDMGAYELQDEPIETIPNCTSIITPLDGAIDVSLLPTIQWDAVANATSYLLTLGTTAGGGEVLDNLDVGGVTSYNPTVELEENTVYYLRVVPFNAVGEATGCDEITFTTETLLVVPNCTAITAPVDGGLDVALDVEIRWEEVDGAEGYRVYVGTTPGGTDIVEGTDVIGSSFIPASGWEEGERYFVRVIPFNAAGEATGCSEVSFTTVARPEPPQADDQQFCPPATVEDLVAVGTDIRWYDQATEGSPLPATTILSTGTYYATETVGDMESNRRTVAVTVQSPTAPQFNGDITGCGNLAVADLENVGTGLRWYNQATGGTALPATTALSTGTYYASRVSGTCESDRTPVQVIIRVTPVPDVPDQRFMVGSTFANLNVIGQNLRWYTEPSESTPFDPHTVISNGVYYVSQTIDGCESDRVIVQINITSIPNCVTNINPTNNATNVPIDANITWDAADEADGYRVYIGTSTGGTNIVHGEEVTGTSYRLAGGWEEGETYFVRVIPFNAAGEAIGCSEVNFATETQLIVPNCALIVFPVDDAENVSLGAALIWNEVENVDGYRVYVGTAPGETDVVNGQEVIDTSFIPASGWEEGETYFVRVIAFNAAGEATGCSEVSFTTVVRPAPPQADDQQFCPPATVADLVAIGTDIRWYTQATGGSPLSITTTLSTGTYYATQTVGGMESNRRSVAITAQSPTAPQFNGAITGCGNLTVADLENVGTGLRWYNQSNGGVALSPTITLSTGTYYASRVSGNCESDRTPVQVIIRVTPVPDVPDQPFVVGSTFADLDVIGQNLRWYTETSGSTSFDAQTIISNGTYYVSQTIAGCESDRVIVRVTITSVPNCVTNISPADDAMDVSVGANITWDEADGADGYRIYIGTSQGGTDIVNGEEVTGTSYRLAGGWEEGETYFVQIIPFNAAGEATGCPASRFVIVQAETPQRDIGRTKYGISPNGDGVNDQWDIAGIELYPDNTVSIYNRWGDMVFQIHQYDNQSRVFRGVANRLTGWGGGVLPDGTYFFNIRYREGQDAKQVEGFLVIKR